MQATLVTALLVLVPIVVAAQEVSVPSYRAPAKSASSAQAESLPRETKVARGEAPLSSLYDGIKLDPSDLLRLPPLKVSEMKDETSDKRLRIGAARVLPKTLDARSDARTFSLLEGEVSLLGIASERALQVRVHFAEVNLTKGARIFVYSLTNPEEVYGPFEGRGPTGTGEFWTPPVRGEGIVIEYLEPHVAKGSRRRKKVVPFRITQISHIFRD